MVEKECLLKDVHVLIFRTCEYVTLDRKGDFADVIVKDCEWADYLGLSWWAQYNYESH